MKPEELAATLNGREYGNEITPEEEKAAKAAGLVVLFGASDDLAEFCGAIHVEDGAYEGGDLLIVDGKLYEEPDCECKWADAANVAAKKRARVIKAVWNDASSGYSWTYETDIPHATFDVMEDGEKFCRGIVFALAATRGGE